MTEVFTVLSSGPRLSFLPKKESLQPRDANLKTNNLPLILKPIKAEMRLLDEVFTNQFRLHFAWRTL
jgi:hypothetical protein